MIWKGHVSFGLVNIPVALHPAVTRDELDFTLPDKKDLSPIGYRKVNKRTASAREPRKGEVIDLMELLKRSVGRRGKASAGKRRSAVRARRTA
jgi:non-homologous end joining protein Ku